METDAKPDAVVNGLEGSGQAPSLSETRAAVAKNGVKDAIQDAVLAKINKPDSMQVIGWCQRGPGFLLVQRIAIWPSCQSISAHLLAKLITLGTRGSQLCIV